MEVHDQHRLAKSINEDICKTFSMCLVPTSRKLAMERVLSIPNVNVNTLDYMLHVKLVVAQYKMLDGVSRSLEEAKQANSNTKLASKHCILATTISASPTSSIREIAKKLGVHHWNVANAMER
jgi:hypothetical protein